MHDVADDPAYRGVRTDLETELSRIIKNET